MAGFQQRSIYKSLKILPKERKKIRKHSINLSHRWITAILFIPALIIIARAGGVYFLILIELGIFLGVYEFCDILRERGLTPYKSLAIISSLILGLNAYFQSHLFTVITITALVIVVAFAELFRRKKEEAIFHLSGTVFGVIYVGWLFSHLILLMQMPEVLEPLTYKNIFGIPIRLGTSLALLPFVITWSNDSAAFFIGRKFGKAKFFPVVSPKKTWEGVIGGAFAAIGAAFIYHYLYASYLSWFDCMTLGIVVGIVAPIGDLVESMIKRDVKIKDASAIIPGHGGFLDRFDSLLFTAPLIYYYLRFFAVR
jgi:phosphatidate cytidylyltransferase